MQLGLSRFYIGILKKPKLLGADSISKYIIGVSFLGKEEFIRSGS